MSFLHPLCNLWFRIFLCGFKVLNLQYFSTLQLWSKRIQSSALSFPQEKTDKKQRKTIFRMSNLKLWGWSEMSNYGLGQFFFLIAGSLLKSSVVILSIQCGSPIPAPGPEFVFCASWQLYQSMTLEAMPRLKLKDNNHKMVCKQDCCQCTFLTFKPPSRYK